MMRILIIEDEKRIAKQLEKLIKEILGDAIQRLNHVDTLSQGRDFILNNTIDLLFLDLNLKGKDGFTILEEMVSESFHTIVVSAYTNEALKAFDYGVLDFVAKPFNRARLQKAILRFTEKEDNSKYFLKYLAVKKFGKIEMINLDEVNYIQASGHYSELFLFNGKKELHSKSLDKLITLLPESFERIHRSYAVRLDRIDQFKRYPGSKYEVLLKNGIVIPCSRKKFKELSQKFI